MTMKFTLWKKKQLDEMQEQKLLKIEHNGFWIGFWGLVIAMLIQLTLIDPNEGFQSMTGEIIVFMCMAVYTIIACMRGGLWDRHIPATLPVNLGLSLFSSSVTALFFSLLSYKNYHNLTVAVYTFVFQFILLSIVIFTALTITSFLTKKKRQKLDAEDSDSE